MAKLKATPKNFVEAQQVLGTKSSVRLGNNTHLVRIAHDGGIAIAVALHNTYIVIFRHDGRVNLYTGGYRTVTTKERINQFISGRVYQYKHEWFYETQRYGENYDKSITHEFVEGIEVSK